MWIFTPLGFFSVVEHRDNACNVLIRARDKKHLTALIDRMQWTVSIQDTPDADYQCRIVVEKDDWAAALHVLAHDIEYTNFKAAVPSKTLFSDVLHGIWRFVEKAYAK